MDKIVRCQYCDSYSQYDDSDLQVAFAPGLDGIYITCPACKAMIIVGAVNL